MIDSPAHADKPRLLAFALGCAALILVAAFFARGLPRGSALRIGLAALQGIATGAVIVTSMLHIRRLDELKQRMHFEALAIAFAGTGVLATAYGFLVSAGLPDIKWGTLIWPAMVVLWMVGLMIANRRYR